MAGIEVAKFDAAMLRRYIDAYLDFYQATVGATSIGKRDIGAPLSNTIEVGAANWMSRLLK